MGGRLRPARIGGDPLDVVRPQHGVLDHLGWGPVRRVDLTRCLIGSNSWHTVPYHQSNPTLLFHSQPHGGNIEPRSHARQSHNPQPASAICLCEPSSEPLSLSLCAFPSLLLLRTPSCSRYFSASLQGVWGVVSPAPRIPHSPSHRVSAPSLCIHVRRITRHYATEAGSSS